MKKNQKGNESEPMRKTKKQKERKKKNTPRGRAVRNSTIF
jgi:hypothetical protein